MFSIMKKRFLNGMTVALTSAALVLTGCEGLPVQNDPTDTCNAFRQKISAAKKTELNARIGSAVGGAAIGAFASIIAGADQKTTVRNTVIGGLAGFALAYYKQKQSQAKDNASLLRSVNQDARTERNLVSATGRAAASLRTCRRNEIKTLSANVRSGKVDKSAARSSLRNLQSRISSDNRLISSAFGGIDQRVDAYISATAATAEVDKSLIYRDSQRRAAASTSKQRAAASRARRSTPQVTSVARETNQQKANDVSRRASVERDLEALEALLS